MQPETEAAPLTCLELGRAVETDAAFRTVWRGLTEGHREEYGRWISGAADAEARDARILRVRHRLVPGSGV